MDPVTQRQSSGAALVFILMALIAILALGVVFLSRIGRDLPVDKPDPAQTEASVPGIAEDAGVVSPADNVTTNTADTTETPVSDPVVIPPPPPPINTPDTRNLPPEG